MKTFSYPFSSPFCRYPKQQMILQESGCFYGGNIVYLIAFFCFHCCFYIFSAVSDQVGRPVFFYLFFQKYFQKNGINQ